MNFIKRRGRKHFVGNGMWLSVYRGSLFVDFFFDVIYRSFHVTSLMVSTFGQRQPVRRADNLTTFMCRLS